VKPDSTTQRCFL